MTAFTLARVEAYAYRVPIATPIKVAFGTFRDRPMVVVRVVDRDGAEGFGEVWCNWPAVGAEHRARLAVDIGARLIGRPFASPEELYHDLRRGLETLVIQTGEVGPIAQVVAGIDIAVSDLAARRAALPLYRWLGAAPVSHIPVYATGINPDRPEDFALARQTEGHRRFKLKIGFGEDLDLRNLRAMRDALGPEAAIMTDANQAFDREAAMRVARAIAPLDLRWFEEPMRVDARPEDWSALAQECGTPLAGGENLHGADLDEACRGDVLRVIQPDATKSGGVSGTIKIARAAVAAGKSYCPHVFGGGIATLVSLHLLAAAGGDGLLEFDCFPNAGRESIVDDLLPVSDGRVPVPDNPGIGVMPNLAALRTYQTWAGSD